MPYVNLRVSTLSILKARALRDLRHFKHQQKVSMKTEPFENPFPKLKASLRQPMSLLTLIMIPPILPSLKRAGKTGN